MIDETIEYFEDFAENMGLSIKILRSGKKVLSFSAASNGNIGIGLVTFGLLTSYKWVIILGSLGIASSVIMEKEAKNMK